MQTALLAQSAAVDDDPSLQDSISRQRLRKWRRKQALKRLVNVPLFPAKEVVFDALFWKKVFFAAEVAGFMNNERKAIHILNLRRFLRRFFFLVDVYSEGMQSETMQSLKNLPTWVRWEDVAHNVIPEPDDGREQDAPLPAEPSKAPLMITVTRNVWERLSEVLEENNTWAGRIWSIIMMTCILINLAFIVLGADQFPARTNGFTIIVFTVEYLLKLICAFYCRRSLLNMDGIIAEMIPPADQDPNRVIATAGSGPRRMLDFVLAPMNIIDLVSILPWWLHELMGVSPFRLGFLRILRVLRIIRLMNIGSFTRDFQIMGEVFGRSAGAIMAITTTLTILSLLFGAVMVQLESSAVEADPENWVWISNDVWMEKNVDDHSSETARSMLWAAGRLTSSQSSLANKMAIPAQPMNAFLVHIIGVVKGFVFLLPLGQIKQFFAESDKHRKNMDNLEMSVDGEKFLKTGDRWTTDPKAPHALVEVFHANDDIGPTISKSHGQLNLPISVGKSVELTTYLCKITGLSEKHCTASEDDVPGILFEAGWEVHKTGVSSGGGVLTIRVMTGIHFPPDQLWKLRISVPESLYGDRARVKKITEASTGSGMEPAWKESFKFNVDWSAQEPVSQQLEAHLQAQQCTIRNLESLAQEKMQ